MLNMLNIVRSTFVYAIKSAIYGYQVKFENTENSWVVAKKGKVYFMDTKRKCYEYVCQA